GVVHGPTPRDYSQRTPKKMKAAALRGALSDRARAGQLHVVTELVTGEKPSTKAAKAAIAAVTQAKRVLVVLHRDDELGWVSARTPTRPRSRSRSRRCSASRWSASTRPTARASGSGLARASASARTPSAPS